MFGKNKEKKGRWWKNNEQSELKIVAGKNYKLTSGFMILCMIGLFIIGLAQVLHNTPSLSNEPTTYKSLLWIGITLCGTAFLGVLVSVLIQIRQSQNAIKKNEKIQEYNSKLAALDEKYHKTQKEMLGIPKIETKKHKKSKKLD